MLPEVLAPLTGVHDLLTQVSEFTPQSFNVRAVEEREERGTGERMVEGDIAVSVGC